MEEPRNHAWIGFTPLASRPSRTETEAEAGMFLGGGRVPVMQYQLA